MNGNQKADELAELEGTGTPATLEDKLDVAVEAVRAIREHPEMKYDMRVLKSIYEVSKDRSMGRELQVRVQDEFGDKAVVMMNGWIVDFIMWETSRKMIEGEY